jgi:putative sterol carrier protein
VVKFLTPEWVDRAKDIILKELDPVRDLKSATASFILVITNIPPNGGTRSVYVSVAKGRLTEMLMEERDISSEKKAEFVVLGNYDTFVQIVQGQMSIVGALLKGRVEFKGSTMKALTFQQPIEKIIECLRKVPTEF